MGGLFVKAGVTMQTVCIRAKYLWDGTHDQVIENGAVILQNGRIMATGPAESLELPERCEITDFGDASIIPGLIDAHTHPVCYPAGLEAHEFIHEQSGHVLYEITKDNILRHLRSGVTTLFDNGGYRDITLRVRDEVKNQMYPGADIWASKVILRPACPNVRSKGGDVDASDPEKVASFVRNMAEQDKVDWFKLYITRGGLSRHLPQYFGWGPVFSDEAMTALVREAHAFGRKVGAHAVTAAGVESMIRNKGDLIIHCQFWGENGLHRIPDLEKRIADSGIWVNPTLFTSINPYYVNEARKQYMPLTPVQEAESKDCWETYRITQEIIRSLRDLGVPMIAGSDAGFCYVNFGEFRCELYEYEKLGLPILEILKLATVNPAAFMGKTGQLGCLAAGADADIAVFRGNLFRDLHKLDEPAAVYKKGIRYL